MVDLPKDIDLVKNIKTLKFKKMIGFLMSLGIPTIFVIAMLVILIANIMGAAISTISIPFMNLGVQLLLIGGRKYNDKVQEEYKALTKKITDSIDQSYLVTSLSDVQIIPKNLKLGEDLSHKNVIEIFREGHYVLIHAFPEDLLVRQYKDDDTIHLELLTDEDREEALEELSNDGIKRLELR